MTGGPDLTLFEVNEAAEVIREKAHPEANIIFGAVIDESMDSEISITVIATGFDTVAQQHRPREARASKIREFPVRKFDNDDLDIPAFLRRR